jgi:hypothetical protein
VFDLFDLKRNGVIEFGEFVRSLSIFHPKASVSEKTKCMSELEFFTDQTTCASEMLERTPSENFCQKGPAVGGGTPGAGDTCPLPPGPLPAGPCRRWHRRHVAWRGDGGRAWRRQAACRHPHWRQVAGQGPCRHRHWRQVGHAATPTGGRWQGGACRHPHWRQVAGRGHAATPNGGRGTRRLPRGCRHPQLVLFDKKFRRGSFLAFHSRRWSDPSKIPGFYRISYGCGQGIALLEHTYGGEGRARNH